MHYYLHKGLETTSSPMFRRGKQGGQNSCRGSQPLRAGIQELGQGWWDSRSLWGKWLLQKQEDLGYGCYITRNFIKERLDREQDISVEGKVIYQLTYIHK